MIKPHLPSPLANSLLLAGSICLLIAATPAWAQQGRTIQRDLGGGRQELPELPEADPGAPQEPDLELPPLPDIPLPPSPSAQRVRIDRVEFSGNEAISDEALRAVAAPFTGRELSLEELFELQDALTDTYVEQGYLNSGALLVSGQDVGDGVVEYAIIEGRLSEVRIEGLDSVDEEFFRRRILQSAGQPFNSNKLTERMRVLLLRPDFDSIQAELTPGSRPGEAELALEVAEGRNYALALEAANDKSPSIGEAQGRLRLTARNLAGRTDVLNAALGINEGLREARASYELPVTDYDLRLYASARYSESEVITSAIRNLDIESTTLVGTIGMRVPIIDRADQRLELDFSLGREHQRTELLGEDFDLSPGSKDGRIDLTVARFTQSYLHRGATDALSVASTFSFGLPILGASDSAPDAKRDFVSWFGQAQYVRRVDLLTNADQVVLRSNLQLTDDPLFSSETFAVGGIDSVRGWRINELVDDIGYEASLEYRFNLTEFLRPENDLTARDNSLQLVAFVDAGGVADSDAGNSQHIVGAGGGFIYGFSDRLSAELYAGGRVYRDIDGAREGSSEAELQDAGMGFRLNLQLQ